jgi:hypothetical protein
MDGIIHQFEIIGTSNDAVFAEESITPQLFSGVDWTAHPHMPTWMATEISML